MKKFEYRIISTFNEDPITELNQLGSQGWEVFHIDRRTQPHERDPGQDVSMFFWLKRRI